MTIAELDAQLVKLQEEGRRSRQLAVQLRETAQQNRLILKNLRIARECARNRGFPFVKCRP